MGGTVDEHQTLMDTSKFKAVCASLPPRWWQPPNQLTLWGASSRQVVPQRTGEPPRTGRCREAAGSEPVDETETSVMGSIKTVCKVPSEDRPSEHRGLGHGTKLGTHTVPGTQECRARQGRATANTHQSGARPRQSPVTLTAPPQLQLKTKGE